MDDSQLVYVSFSNQALAHLPYMVALDESSRSALCYYLYAIVLGCP